MVVRFVLVATLTLATLTPTSARAQQGLGLEEIALMLNADSRDEVQMALEAAVVYGKPAVVPLIVERVSMGLPPPLLDLALDALSLVPHKDAEQLLTRLVRHRRRSVRVKAIKALAATGGKGASKTLAAALADMDERVRVAAVEGLGELGNRSALDKLFVAFDRGIPGAPAAIGKLATAKHLRRISGYTGNVPFGQMRPMWDGMLERKDLKAKDKLRIVAMVEELGTPQAREYLTALGNSLPAGKLRSAALSAADRIVEQ